MNYYILYISAEMISAQFTLFVTLILSLHYTCIEHGILQTEPYTYVCTVNRRQYKYISH